MINDFDALFPSENQSPCIPPSLKREMDAQVGEGFAYEDIGGGAYALTWARDKKIKVDGDGPTFSFQEDGSKVFVTHDAEEANRFRRTSLLPMYVQYEKWRTTLGEKEFDAQMLVRCPQGEMHNQVLYLPPLEPMQLSLKLGCGDLAHRFVFTQKKSLERTVACFESQDEGYPLSVTCSLDLGRDALNVRFNISIEKANSAKQYYEAATIYNAFLEGRGEIDGHAIGGLGSDGSHRIDNDAISFYKMAAGVESTLGIRFAPYAEMGRDDSRNVARLYCMLVLKRGLWHPNNAVTWTLERSPVDETPPFPLTIIMTHEEDMTILGTLLTVYGYRKLVDANVIEIKDLPNGGVQLVFETLGDGEHNYAELLTGTKADSLDDGVPSYVIERFERTSDMVSLLKSEGIIP